jgi:hypothetical protein
MKSDPQFGFQLNIFSPSFEVAGRKQVLTHFSGDPYPLHNVVGQPSVTLLKFLSTSQIPELTSFPK